MREATLIPTPFGAWSPMSVMCSSAPSSGRPPGGSSRATPRPSVAPMPSMLTLTGPRSKSMPADASKRNSEPVGVRFGCTCTAIVCTRTRP